MAVKKGRQRNKALDSLKVLRANCATSASFHPNGNLASVSFVAAAESDPLRAAPTTDALVQPEQKPQLVSGTSFPDDKTPLNPLDTVMNVPKWSADEVDKN